MEHHTFRTSSELGIPEGTHSGLIELMLDLRSGALPWDRDYLSPGYRGSSNSQAFNMSLHNRCGGGPSCIIGWLERRNQYKNRGLWGPTYPDLRFLEFPSEGGLPTDAHEGLNTIGPQEAAMAIQVYLETGTRRPWADARVAAAREIDHAPQH